MSSPSIDQTALLKDILESLKVLQLSHTQLASNVDAISGRVNILSGIKEVRDAAAAENKISTVPAPKLGLHEVRDHVDTADPLVAAPGDSTVDGNSISVSHARKPSITSRIILT